MVVRHRRRPGQRRPGFRRALHTHNDALYTPNTPPLHKEIRKAIEEAQRHGLATRHFSGHTWGQVECSCGADIKIYSTGSNPDFGAKLIRKFIQRHRDHQGGKS